MPHVLGLELMGRIVSGGADEVDGCQPVDVLRPKRMQGYHKSWAVSSAESRVGGFSDEVDRPRKRRS